MKEISDQVAKKSSKIEYSALNSDHSEPDQNEYDIAQ